jgi:hypothetical protein
MRRVQLLSQVLGALVAGALIFAIARQAGIASKRAVSAVAVVPLVIAGLLVLPALRDGSDSLLDQRKENAGLTGAAAQYHAGTELGIAVPFLEWVGERIPEGDTFHLEVGVIPEETYVDGVGVRQAAILQWSLFQLAPRLAVEQSAKAHDIKSGEGQNADWFVFYEAHPGEFPAIRFGRPAVYAPGFMIARNDLAR